MTVFAIPGLLMAALSLGIFALQAFALVDALSQRKDAFVAADKLTKPAWLIILGLAVVVHLLFWSPLSLLNLAGTVAAIVYLVDARPAIRSLTRS